MTGPRDRRACDTLPPLIGTSPAIQRAKELIGRYAPTQLPILVVGPTGTGKELVARHIHARSGRTGRLVPVNCAALPREMAESLLFGHRRGAFSGAVESRRGYIASAHGGTIFLDEVLCLAAESQAKLLRALDTGEIQPLGEEGERFVDLRVVAAAQEAVWADLTQGTLRLDLYQRIAGVLVVLPALAQRPQDIVQIAKYLATGTGRVLEAGAHRVLEDYTWPGNVRELKQVIDRAGHLVENGTLPPAAIAEAIALGTPPHSPAVATARPRGRAVSRQELVAACEGNGWDAVRVAAALGVGRTTLFKWLRQWGLGLPRSSSRGHE